MLLAYSMYEGARALMAPARVAADLTRYGLQMPGNPLAYGPYARAVSAGCEMFERVTRQYGKPAFGFTETVVDGVSGPDHRAGGLGAAVLPPDRLRPRLPDAAPLRRSRSC